MATSHVDMFHQMKSQLLKEHEAAVGQTVDRKEWEKAMEQYFGMMDSLMAAQRRPSPPVQPLVVETEQASSSYSSGLWMNC